MVFGLPPAWAITAAEEPLVKVVEKMLPMVVNINSEHVVQGRVTDPFSQFFGRYYQQRVPSLGSGVVVSADGYVVTCAHVVERAENQQVKATLGDGSIFRAKLISSDYDLDLALLQIEDSKSPLPFLDLRQLSPNLLGQTVVALGNPVGYESSISKGILSARNRSIRTDQGSAEGLLQTDAAINPGNSGGALIDIEGKFVGLSSAKFTGQAIEGIGFAIPGETVSNWVADAIAIAKGEKKAPKPISLVEVVQKKFGLTLQELTPELAQSFGLATTNGLLVADVEKNGPAEKVGIKVGMLVVRLGNVNVASEASLPRQLTKIKPGEQMPVTIAVAERRGNFVIQRSAVANVMAR